VGGAILCALGILGEYVGRIYEEVKGRPLYVVKERSTNLEAISASQTRASGRAA